MKTKFPAIPLNVPRLKNKLLHLPVFLNWRNSQRRKVSTQEEYEWNKKSIKGNSLQMWIDYNFYTFLKKINRTQIMLVAHQTKMADKICIEIGATSVHWIGKMPQLRIAQYESISIIWGSFALCVAPIKNVAPIIRITENSRDAVATLKLTLTLIGLAEPFV